MLERGPGVAFRMVMAIAAFGAGCGSSEQAAGGGPAPDAAEASSGGSTSGDGAADTGAGGVSGQSGSGGSGAAGGKDCGAALPSETVVDPASTQELIVAGDPGAALGIFDPSPVYPAGAAAGALAYSAVPAQDSVHTRVAVSNDQGASFTYVATVNTAGPASFAAVGDARCPNGTCSGRMIHEVPSLVFDAEDPDATRRWKLFTHSYLVLSNGELARDLGYVSLYVASEPAGPWALESKPIGWRSKAEISSQDALLVATDYGQMADCLVLTEPAALSLPGGTLELALGCASVSGGKVRIRIELVRSLDHGKSFGYAGRLLEADAAQCLGAALPELNAAHLFFAQGQTYLSVSAAGPTSGGFPGYRGCQVFEVLTATASVNKDTAGNPIVVRAIDAPDDRFIGACAYAEGATPAGYLVPMLALEQGPRVFRIYASGITAP
jgi:hypothetical protein